MSQTRAQLVKGLSNTSGTDDTITVDSNGQVGINATSPGTRLDVQESNSDSIPTNADVASAGLIRIQNTNNSAVFGGIGLQARSSSSAQWLIATQWTANNQGDLVLRTRNASTTSAEIGRFLNGGGLTFNGDTAAANALDDYEEGTWTPTCESDGNIGSSQYTNTYTKIGRLVTINCDIHALDNITSTNPIKIGGLPFVPSNTSGELGSTAVHGERVDSSIVVAFLQYLANTWVIRFRKGVGSNNYSDIDHSDLNNAGDNNMRFSLTYEITG